jgi:plasmid stabilization system protein ParE
MGERYQVIVTARAKRSLRRALAWWAENRPEAPLLILEELEGAKTLLEAAPGAGVAVAFAPGARRWLLPQTRYHLYYRVDDAQRIVRVLVFWHGSRGASPRV